MITMKCDQQETSKPESEAETFKELYHLAYTSAEQNKKVNILLKNVIELLLGLMSNDLFSVQRETTERLIADLEEKGHFK